MRRAPPRLCRRGAGRPDRVPDRGRNRPGAAGLNRGPHAVPLVTSATSTSFGRSAKVLRGRIPIHPPGTGLRVGPEQVAGGRPGRPSAVRGKWGGAGAGKRGNERKRGPRVPRRKGVGDGKTANLCTSGRGRPGAAGPDR